jgi:hypothetical protein
MRLSLANAMLQGTFNPVTNGVIFISVWTELIVPMDEERTSSEVGSATGVAEQPVKHKPISTREIDRSIVQMTKT